MGLDPGFRSGVKGRRRRYDRQGGLPPPRSIRTSRRGAGDEALATLGKLAVQHRVDLIAIGNGTASRETDKLAMDLVKLLPDLKMSKVRGVGSRRLGLFGVRLLRPRNCRNSTSHYAVPCRLPGGCKIRWPNWSRLIRRPSASDNISMTLARANCRARSMR